MNHLHGTQGAHERLSGMEEEHPQGAPRPCKERGRGNPMSKVPKQGSEHGTWRTTPRARGGNTRGRHGQTHHGLRVSREKHGKQSTHRRPDGAWCLNVPTRNNQDPNREARRQPDRVAHLQEYGNGQHKPIRAGMFAGRIARSPACPPPQRRPRSLSHPLARFPEREILPRPPARGSRLKPPKKL